MKHSPKLYSRRAQVAAYVQPTVRDRVNAITRANPRYTMSRIGEECLEHWLPKIEKRLGLNGHSS